MKSAYEKAKSLGAKMSGGINWTWADFKDEQTAKNFDLWCNQNGYETRGVYSPYGKVTTYGVRFR